MNRNSWDTKPLICSKYSSFPPRFPVLGLIWSLLGSVLYKGHKKLPYLTWWDDRAQSVAIAACELGDPSTTAVLPDGPAPGPVWVETWARFCKGLESRCDLKASSEDWHLDLCWCPVMLKGCSGNYYLFLFPTGLIRWAKGEGEQKSSSTFQSMQERESIWLYSVFCQVVQVKYYWKKEGVTVLTKARKKNPDTKVIWKLKLAIF